MTKPELQMVYWTHGKYDIPLVDELQEKIYPQIFQDDALNILGIEAAGGSLDAISERILIEGIKNPTNVLIGMPSDPKKGLCEHAEFIVNQINDSYLNHTSIDYQIMLAGKWNKEHTQRPVTLLFEPSPNEASRQRWDKDGRMGLFEPGGEKFYWQWESATTISPHWSQKN